MKNKLSKLIVLIALCIASSLLALACTASNGDGGQGGLGEQGSGNQGVEITSVVFNDVTVNYDGESHTILASGAPSGTNVTYANAGPYINAGEYTITVTVAGEGYKTFTKTAKLTINKIEYPTDIVLNSKKYFEDGLQKELLVTGSVPTGTQITYLSNLATSAGVYYASATLKNSNYVDKTLSATLTISNAVKFTNKTVDYNGNAQTIKVSGAPAGANVTYVNAGPYVNAGEYSITATVNVEGYETFTKTAKLKINKIQYPNTVTFENKKVVYTGSEKVIEVMGDIPSGTQITYTNNTATQGGQYVATATLKNPNYVDKTLTATLTIVNVLDVAKTAVNNLLERPDPWEYMPQAFNKENFALKSAPIVDFTNNVNVNDISKKFMGKNMYVLWEGVNEMDALLSKFDVVYSIGETIANAYQTYINDNPDDHAEWTGTVLGFKVKIVLNGNESTMLVGNNAFSVELFADKDNAINKGRIDVANAGVLNYEIKDGYLKFNMSVLIKGVLALKQVEFVKNEEVVSGYFYEYLGLESVATKTSAVIAFNENYAIVMGSSLLTKGIEEVYSTTTGEYLSGKEVMKDSSENLYVHVKDISGITSVKAVENGSTTYNNYDVFVNGLSTTFKPSYNKALFVNTTRRFDIEMKTAYYIQEVVNGEDTSYEVKETLVPLMFIQNQVLETFGSEAKSENPNVFSIAPTYPTNKVSVANANFDNFKELLTTVQTKLTYQELQAEIGTKNEFFTEQA